MRPVVERLQAGHAIREIAFFRLGMYFVPIASDQFSDKFDRLDRLRQIAVKCMKFRDDRRSRRSCVRLSRGSAALISSGKFTFTRSKGAPSVGE